MCENLASTGYTYRMFPDNPEGEVRYKMIEVKCGSMYGGETYLCEKCEKAMQKRYSQGWRYYPGDTCKHGVYVGGCMEDFMCVLCENGD